ncbi:MAG: phage head-tail connector protein [Carnobacterium sp.]|uniref:phage head-tail connector protein n=1 Tax=Carnobacterium sp. TaxID=48221 RepID=UPI002FCC6DDA
MVNVEDVLKTIKPLLEIADDDLLQDIVIKQLIDDAKSNILAYVNRYKPQDDQLTDYPLSIEWVLRGVVIKLYNRLGDEGKKSSGEEGLSSTWDDSLLSDYQHALDPLMGKKYGRGIARFF